MTHFKVNLFGFFVYTSAWQVENSNKNNYSFGGIDIGYLPENYAVYYLKGPIPDLKKKNFL